MFPLISIIIMVCINVYLYKKIMRIIDRISYLDYLHRLHHHK